MQGVLQDDVVAAADGLVQMGTYYMSGDGGTNIQHGGNGSDSSRHDHLSSSYFKFMNRAQGTGGQVGCLRSRHSSTIWYSSALQLAASDPSAIAATVELQTHLTVDVALGKF